MAIYNDGEACPYERDEPCLNCGEDWVEHHGWACPDYTTFSADTCRSLVPADFQYFTSDMKAATVPTLPSMPAAKPSSNSPKDISSWEEQLRKEVEKIKKKRGTISSSTKSKPQKANDGPDLSDWKVWRDSSVKPGECVCGCLKKDCSYHKNS